MSLLSICARIAVHSFFRFFRRVVVRIMPSRLGAKEVAEELVVADYLWKYMCELVRAANAKSCADYFDKKYNSDGGQDEMAKAINCILDLCKGRDDIEMAAQGDDVNAAEQANIRIVRNRAVSLLTVPLSDIHLIRKY